MYEEIEQGTAAWLKIRSGKATASRIADIMAQGKGGAPSASRANYRAQLIAERLTGEPSEEGYKNAIMERGNELEPQARALYGFHVDEPLSQVAFIDHQTIPMSGASPDCLVGEHGQAEFKCPNTATHIDWLDGGSIPSKYILQMQWNLACTGRRWFDFVSFDLRLPAEMQLFTKRIPRDAQAIVAIERAVQEFLAEVDAKAESLRRAYMKG